MDIKTLVKLTSRAWTLNILAQLHGGVPGRQAPLLAATGASRTAFSASLEHLVSLRLLERNPGHGHPLRPEYRMTQSGVRAAAVASKILALTPDETEFKMLRRAWTLPVLALTREPRRFSGLRSDLVEITDRALSTSLKQLEAKDWVQRDINTSVRLPFPTYQAVNLGFEINRAVGLSAS